jgi:hypothetical protein
MTTTAPAVMTAAPVSVADILKFQNDAMRMRNYVFIGWVQRIVLEVTEKMYIPPEIFEDLKSDPMGPCIEFMGQENWLPVGQIEAAGMQSMLLPLAPVKRKDGRVGFPDKPDRHWVPSTGPKSIPVKDPETGQVVRYKMEHEAPRMQEQPLRNFSTGILRDSNLIVYERVAQILVKAQGIAEGWIIKCGLDPATGTHMTFLLDHQTGESHFYGGLYVITRPGVQ